MNILAIGAHPDDIELGCGGLTSYNDNARRALDYNPLPQEFFEWRREVPQENPVLKG